MCNNADNPCPGCRKHDKIEAARMFLAEDERQPAETAPGAPAMVVAHS